MRYLCFKVCFACLGDYRYLRSAGVAAERKRGDRFRYLCFKVCFACLGDYRYLPFAGVSAEEGFRVGDTQEQAGLVRPRAGDAQGWSYPEK